MQEAMLVGGIMKGYLVSNAVNDPQGGWRLMYGAAAPVALVMGLGGVRMDHNRSAQSQHAAV